jgi:hypothetical protein
MREKRKTWEEMKLKREINVGEALLAFEKDSLHWVLIPLLWPLSSIFFSNFREGISLALFYDRNGEPRIVSDKGVCCKRSVLSL